MHKLEFDWDVSLYGTFVDWPNYGRPVTPAFLTRVLKRVKTQWLTMLKPGVRVADLCTSPALKFFERLNPNSSGNFYSLNSSMWFFLVKFFKFLIVHVLTYSDSELAVKVFFRNRIWPRYLCNLCIMREGLILRSYAKSRFSAPSSGPFMLWKANFERSNPGPGSDVISTYVAIEIHPLTSKHANGAFESACLWQPSILWSWNGARVRGKGTE